ncbi:TniB family NTP-binding protein [Hymenobacter sp. BRD67]|uniref:TniB family NTP-binding protein n=1 Tax=Hymenobacter sp. BRD67 TaxID=2675877 RepID=UPI0015675320|nr:TniB family NTP-binding protein [Hymenobacter sp. BRD67]QKG51823.1 TniB family NTP-binding protein [Hymenobacter sp. BRD67]
MSLPHLSPEAAVLLDLPVAERKGKISEMKWIPYARARRIGQKMHDLLHHPPSYRMPNLLVVGDTGNGKTHIIRRFEAAHPSYTREKDGHLIAPVLYLQAPPDADEKSFYHALLDITGTPYRAADRGDRKQRQVINTLRRLETRLLIIDEIQHVLAGNQTRQRQFLNVLKYLSNELMLPLVGAGIGTAFNAIQHDEQLASRFEPIGLPRWRMGEEYIRLLMTFERLLPLQKPSLLSEEKMAYKLLSMSEGSLGELTTILQRAAIQAVDTKEECISLKLLGKLDYSTRSDLSSYEKLMAD